MSACASQKVLFSKGNKKLPKDTYIMNVGTALDCPSEKLGLCPVARECYAKKAERIYPQVTPYRQAQRKVFDDVSAADIASAIIGAKDRAKKPMRKFRFSEAGDFANQSDVDKMADVCRLLSVAGLDCYGYTARTDLDLSRLLAVASVCISNDLNRSKWMEAGANRFEQVKKFSGKRLRCVADCTICDFCSRYRGKVIEVEIH